MNHLFIIRAKHLSPDDDSLQTIIHHHRRAGFAAAIKYLLLLFLPGVLFFSKGIGQTTTTFPAASSCTSKDLTLTGATLPGTDACNTCISGDSVYPLPPAVLPRALLRPGYCSLQTPP